MTSQRHPLPGLSRTAAIVLAGLVLLAVAASPAAAAEPAAGCQPTMVDLTPPDVQALLTRGELRDVGTPEVRWVAAGDGDETVTKVSRQSFYVYDDEGNIVGGGSYTCSATCTGMSCGVSGCDPWAGDCSFCNCTGECTTSCKCSKTANSSPAPEPAPGPAPAER